MKYLFTISTLLLLSSKALLAQKIDSNQNYKSANITMGGFAQYWIPTGNLSIGGHDPGAGVNAGIDLYDYFNIQIVLSTRFNRATNQPYSFYNGENTDTGNKYSAESSLYFLLSYNLIKFNRFVIYPSLGIGEHRIRLDSGAQATSKGLMYNAGVGAKYYLGKYGLLFFDSRYNFINVKNKGGTDLSGGAFTTNIGLAIRMPMFESPHKTIK